MHIVVGYDPVTLREQVDTAVADARLAELGEQRSLRALNERVWLLRLLGRLDEALDVANEALRQARFSGDRETMCLARIRRAQVHQFLGKLDLAQTELAACVLEARDHDWASTEAFALQHHGKVLFDKGDYLPALMDFRTALAIRVRIGAPIDQVDSSTIAISIAERVAGINVSEPGIADPTDG